ncbi:(Fe-S)-binding protein [Motiliproteus sediminis]|uniref:(Fe-S)-binding protein n=1 Tax=Motiliproteus sediminis TaxID=1468178 RepID=UPI001AF00F96|nr:(Fe-S)-binding protein [Motiliproteus sediminis]
MKTALDWSDYTDAGMGDAYADIPKHGGDYGKAVAVCIKSGLCQQPGDRGLMCPSFRASGDKRLSPGGRVELLKQLLNQPAGFAAELPAGLSAAMDSCVSCKGCRRECENAVDMARIKIEYLAQRRHLPMPAGRRLRAHLFATLPHWLHYRPLFKSLIRWRNSSRWLAQLGQRWLGIAADEPLPQPALQPFDKYAAYRRTPEQCDLLLLADTFGHHFEPQLLDTCLQLLQRAGYRVAIAAPAAGDAEPDRPLCCGRTYLSQGWVDEARDEARRMLQAVGPYVERGVPLVGLEPSCLLTLRDEYRALGLGQAAETLAANSLLLEEFIAREQRSGRWALAFALDTELDVSPHCHQRAFGAMRATRRVLQSVAGLRFTLVDSGCCGMAGHVGLEAEQQPLSDTLWQQSEAARAPEAPLTLRNGFSCRHRHRQRAATPTAHLVELLSQALPPGE